MAMPRRIRLGGSRAVVQRGDLVGKRQDLTPDSDSPCNEGLGFGAIGKEVANISDWLAAVDKAQHEKQLI